MSEVGAGKVEQVPRYVGEAVLLYQSEGAEEAVEAAREQARAYAEEHGIRLHEQAAKRFLDGERPAECSQLRHWVVVGEDRMIRRAMDAAESEGVGLGLLPVGKLTQTRDFYDLPGDA